MPSGYFITGTGTDVGKTLVTAGLFRAFLRRGLTTRAVKPVQTGCFVTPAGDVIAPDTRLYEQAAQGLTGGDILVFHTFTPACSPHLAARLAGEQLSVRALERNIADTAEGADVILVEGAGGALVPLNDTETSLNLIKSLGFPVVVVADNRLGMINHTLLTLEVLKQSGVDIAGVVINHCSPVTDENRFIREDNPTAIARFGNAAILGELPFFDHWAPEEGDFWTKNDPFFDTIRDNLTL
ncbi:MAG: dethiobiotin synthase [Lentisphaeria bacterium]|nr:dethiobiotin synthase [Lentisphaeria bacterium]